MAGNFSFDEHAALEKIKAAVHAKIFKVKCPKCGLVAAVREGVTPLPALRVSPQGRAKHSRSGPLARPASSPTQLPLRWLFLLPHTARGLYQSPVHILRVEPKLNAAVSIVHVLTSSIFSLHLICQPERQITTSGAFFYFNTVLTSP